MAKIKPGKNSSKRELITQKAARLFKDKGFSATSMRDLAEMVGVEAPSLYNHITSKIEILQEICFNIANHFTGHINKVESGSIPAIEKVEQVLRFHIRMMIDQFDFVYISDHEWKHLTEPYLSNFQNQRRNYRKRLADLISQGIENHELKPVDPYVAVLTILSAIGGIESWQRSRKVVEVNTLEEDMVKILIAGLKK